MDQRAAGARMRAVARTLDRIGERLEAGEAVDVEPIDLTVAHLKGLRVRAFGRRSSASGSARERLRRHLLANADVDLPGEELAEVAGVSEWARRLRELRAEGLEITQPAPGVYRLGSSGSSFQR